MRARRDIFRRKDNGNRLPDDLIFGVAQKLFDTRIPTDDNARDIRHKNGVIFNIFDN